MKAWIVIATVSFDLCSKPGFYKIMHEAYVPFGTCIKSLHASVCFLPAHIVTPSWMSLLAQDIQTSCTTSDFQTAFGINGPGDKVSKFRPNLCYNKHLSWPLTSKTCLYICYWVYCMGLELGYCTVCGWGSQTSCLFSCINCGLTGNLSPCININKMAVEHTCSSHITTVCQSKHINTYNQTCLRK